MRRHVTPTVRPIICPLLHSVILNRNSLCHMLYLLSSGKLTQFIGLSSFFSSFWLMLVHFISCCCLNWLLVLLSVGRAVVDLVNTHVDASVCSLFGLFRQFIFFFQFEGLVFNIGVVYSAIVGGLFLSCRFGRPFIYYPLSVPTEEW